MRMRILTVVVLSWFFGSTAWSKTDVKGSLQQLKTNEENAKANKKQYEQNAEIASKNVAEVNAALKQLADQKVQLKNNGQNLDKNLAVLDSMKVKLQEYQKDEQTQLSKEQAQIAQVKAT